MPIYFNPTAENSPTEHAACNHGDDLASQDTGDTSQTFQGEIITDSSLVGSCCLSPRRTCPFAAQCFPAGETSPDDLSRITKRNNRYKRKWNKVQDLQRRGCR